MATRRRSTLADLRPVDRRPRGRDSAQRLQRRFSGVRPGRGNSIAPERRPVDTRHLAPLAAGALQAYYNAEVDEHEESFDEEVARREARWDAGPDDPNPVEIATGQAQQADNFMALLDNEGADIPAGDTAFIGPPQFIPRAPLPKKQQLLSEALGALVRNQQIPPDAHPEMKVVVAEGRADQAIAEGQRLLIGLVPQVSQWEFGGEAGRGSPRFQSSRVIQLVWRTIRERYPELDKERGDVMSIAARRRFAIGFEHVKDRFLEVVARERAKNFREGYVKNVYEPRFFGLFDGTNAPGTSHAGVSDDLTPVQERAFQNWFGNWAKKTGINPDPDSPNHGYNFRAAFIAREKPTRGKDGKWKWPEAFDRLTSPQGINKVTPNEDGKTGDVQALTAALQQLQDSTRHLHPGDGDTDMLATFATMQRNVAADRNLSPLEKRQRLLQNMDAFEDVTVGGARTKISDTRQGRELDTLTSQLIESLEGSRGAGGVAGFHMEEAEKLMAPIVKRARELFGDKDITNDAEGLRQLAAARDEVLQSFFRDHPEVDLVDQNAIARAAQQIFGRFGESVVNETAASRAAMQSIRFVATQQGADEARRMAREFVQQGQIPASKLNEMIAEIELVERAEQFKGPGTAFNLAKTQANAALKSIATLKIPGSASDELKSNIERHLVALEQQYAEAVNRALSEDGKDGKVAGEEWMQNTGLAKFESLIMKPIRQAQDQLREIRNGLEQATTNRQLWNDSQRELARQALTSREFNELDRANRAASSTAVIRTLHRDLIARKDKVVQARLISGDEILDFIKESEDNPGLERLKTVVRTRTSAIYHNLVDNGIAAATRAGGLKPGDVEKIVADAEEQAIAQAKQLFEKQQAAGRVLQDAVAQDNALLEWRRAQSTPSEERQWVVGYYRDFDPQIRRTLATRPALAQQLAHVATERRKFKAFSLRAQRAEQDPRGGLLKALREDLAESNVSDEVKAQSLYAAHALLGRVRWHDLIGDKPRFKPTNALPRQTLFCQSSAELDRFEKSDDALAFLKAVGFEGLNEKNPMKTAIVQQWLDTQEDLLEMYGRK